jgi:hypothetical protein
MEISYNQGDYLLRLSADQLLALRYALGTGVERLCSDALFFEQPPKQLEIPEDHARSARETYERAQAVRDELERVVKAMPWPKIEWPHDTPACGPAGGTCLCMR